MPHHHIITAQDAGIRIPTTEHRGRFVQGKNNVRLFEGVDEDAGWWFVVTRAYTNGYRDRARALEAYNEALGADAQDARKPGVLSGPSKDVAYRSYFLKFLGEGKGASSYSIQRDGFHIGYASSVDDGKRKIDELAE